MSIKIIYDDKAYFNADSEYDLKLFIKKVLKEISVLNKKIIPDIGIIFVSKEKIKILNKKYRFKNSYTDVLSFNSDEKGYLGDIILSKEIVAKYAKKFKCSEEIELKRDIIHGILHLIGYDHKSNLTDGPIKDEMLIIQENILNKFL